MTLASRLLLAAGLAVLMASGPIAGVVRADVPGIVAIVNDQPVTDLDLTQRIALLEVLGYVQPGGMDKKKALQSLIDDVVKTQEATRYSMMPSDADLNARIKRMAESMKLTVPALIAKLKEKGISEKSFRNYLAAQMGFSRIIQGKYSQDVKASDAEVDAKQAEIKAKYGSEMAKIMSDPRMKAVMVYSLMEIDFPVEGNDPGLLQARAADAVQVMQRFKGCGNLKAASQGVFDVRQGKTFDADGAKLPPQLKQALDKAGQGRAVGPMRGKLGIQLIANCGTKKITPPKPDFKLPDRDQVQRIVINDKYDKLEADYLDKARGKVYVEYRDQSYAQQ